MTCDVAILGAGIVGAACARALANAGMRVTVIDGRGIAGGATAAGMGHITVMDDSEAQFALTSYSQQLWNELSEQLPDDAEYVKTGTLWLAADDDEMAAARAKHAYYEARGVATEVLDAWALAEAEPNLRPGLTGALRVVNESVIYPPCAARWLLEQARQQGATLALGQPVVQIDGALLRIHDGTTFSCGSMVHATGTWAAELFPGLPIRPRKGHLVITDRYPGFARHQLVELGYLKSAHGHTTESVAFNLQPRRTGQMLLGSSRQFDVLHKDVEPRMLNRMVARALAYMPRLAGLSAIRTWTGFRAATPDSLPLIGPAEVDRHYLATGHEGLGITTSLGTAELVACHLTGRSSAIPGLPYLPSRFKKGAPHG
ncbi:MAG: FAD-binding oxidoreductase [Planctomycetes bacterium]|nr:FAD-binding oxidoreductase [Planctomycetota bacterium]